MNDLKKIIFFTKLIQYTGYSSLLFLIGYSFFTNWWWFLASIIYYKFVVGLFGNQIAQHRYASHKSFKTGPLRHKFLAWISILSGFSPVIYAAVHRHHHVYSDTENDIHSPRVSLWHASIGWTGDWSTEYFNLKKFKIPFDIMRDKDFWFVHLHGYKIFILLTISLLLLNWKIAVFILLAGVGWNHFHMGFVRSALTHIKLPGSYKNFDIDDDSWNNQWLHYFDLGEGLHNNHHKYPNRYDEAFFHGEFDFAGWVTEKIFVKV